MLDNIFIIACVSSDLCSFVESGMTAPQAAGVIHSDFEKGFIRAETVRIIVRSLCFLLEHRPIIDAMK